MQTKDEKRRGAIERMNAAVSRYHEGVRRITQLTKPNEYDSQWADVLRRKIAVLDRDILNTRNNLR